MESLWQHFRYLDCDFTRRWLVLLRKMQEIALFLAALSAGFAFALKWYAL
jgi:hypothetical protein